MQTIDVSSYLKLLRNTHFLQSFPKRLTNNHFSHRKKLSPPLPSVFPCIINGLAWPMVIKHFLHMRDNAGCQLLKRNVKIGAAVVENTDNINDE